MAEYDNRLSGVAFKNDRKTEDWHPEYTGTFHDANNVEHFLDIKVREGKKGKFLSIKVRPKTKRAEAADSAPLDDAMPF